MTHSTWHVAGIVVAAAVAVTLTAGSAVNAEHDGGARFEQAQKGGAMQGYTTDIERDTLANEDFRRVLYTGTHLQLVLMTLKPGEDLGAETHAEHDQFIRIEAGTGVAEIGGKDVPLADGVVVIIPAGVEHNVKNTSGDAPLKLYTLYAPPEHPDGTRHRTKQDADH
jgi:mannose-6-phosphate isomerase-like protein (cupin superfamily)